jgi:hypothetical protein
MARHRKVAEIINRRLREIKAEILRLDCKTMNIDSAGDQSEIARQVLTLLVDRFRGFAVGALYEIAEEREMWGEEYEGEAA